MRLRQPDRSIPLEAMNIVVAHNEPLTGEAIQQELVRIGARVTLVWNEEGMRQKIEHWRQSPPNLIVTSCNLPWTDCAPQMPPAPAEVIDQGPYNAAVRIAELLLQNPPLERIPVIVDCAGSFFSSLHDSTGPIPENIHLFSNYLGRLQDNVSSALSRVLT